MHRLVFDEAHQHMGNGALSADILRLVRETRHRDLWVAYASHDPDSVHPSLIKLSTVLIAHQLKARSSVRVLRHNFAGCEQLDPAELSPLAHHEHCRSRAHSELPWAGMTPSVVGLSPCRWD